MIRTYQKPWFLFNGHFETIYPALFRKVQNLPPIHRERINTPDGDFLDLDWMRSGGNKLVIIQHGLEGSSDRPYVLGMAKMFSSAGFDVCAWNFRGCSGELNKKTIFYHSGATYDLRTVIHHIEQSYQDISLVGFSLGGNLTLKFLGEGNLDKRVKRGVAISTPLDLSESSDQLSTAECRIYERRFLKNLINKVQTKYDQMPGCFDITPIRKIKKIRDFDEFFTAPIHGFKGAEEYYSQNSSGNFLSHIKVPTLIINAANDPLLSKKSKTNHWATDYVDFLLTKNGGHVGYAQLRHPHYWSEERALDFCLKH